MKTLSKLKLTQLSKADLEARQMNALKGGASCSCTCYCTPNCSCTPYPEGGLSNSSTTSNSFSEWGKNTGGNSMLSTPQNFFGGY